MERPNVKNEPKKREITGEIVFLDQMRHDGGGYPGKFEELRYEQAELYDARAKSNSIHYPVLGIRPAIMDLYDEYDGRLSDTEASCIALADELLMLKDEKSPLTFVDICVDELAVNVLGKIKSIKAGALLTADDEQLAIESNGEYYPILDIRKDHADLAGVGLRVWGWDHEKHTYTDSGEEKRDYKKDLLVYPSDEKMAQRQFEITFIYYDRQAAKDGSSHFNESISLTVSEHGQPSLTRSISSMVYAETGYEGHKHESLKSIDEADIAAFGDLVAEIVGDVPESIGMREKRQLTELSDSVASQEAKSVIWELIEITWPAQANHILNLRTKESEKTMAEMLQSEDDVAHATDLLQSYIDSWREKNRD